MFGYGQKTHTHTHRHALARHHHSLFGSRMGFLMMKYGMSPPEKAADESHQEPTIYKTLNATKTHTSCTRRAAS